MIFFVTFLAFGTQLHPSGTNYDLSSLSMIIFTGVMVVVTVMIFLHSQALTIYNFLAIVGSFVMFWGFFMAWNIYIWNGRLLGSFTMLHEAPTFFLVMLLIAVGAGLPTYAYRAYKQIYIPTYSEELRTRYILNKRHQGEDMSADSASSVTTVLLAKGSPVHSDDDEENAAGVKVSNVELKQSL